MISKPKGTYDLFGRDAKIYSYALETFVGICELNNYSFIKTPTFESSELFQRGIGETTDIVTKETFDFEDKKGRKMSLRPEGTARVVRALIENKLYANTNNYLKYYYAENMFRYERPQAGRYREFNQFGVEVFGEPNPYIDAEVINLGLKYFQILGFKNIKVKINSLGDKDERTKYKEALITYLEPYKDVLCEDCQSRLSKNPLRILDCKIDSGSEVFKNLPSIKNYLTDSSNNYFNELQEALDLLEIDYEVDDSLVRGLDYYDQTVFEFVIDDENLGSANTVCGGGRYNELVSSLGGPNVSGVGFAIGYERLASVIKNFDLYKEEKNLDVYVVPVTKNELPDAFAIGTSLKDSGFKTEIDYRETNLKNKLALADKMDASYIVIVGEEELKNYSVILKNSLTKEQETISINDLTDKLYMESNHYFDNDDFYDGDEYE